MQFLNDYKKGCADVLNKLNLTLGKSKMISYIVLAFAFVLIGIDQLIKYYVFNHFQNIIDKTIPLIEDILHISYVENRGVAFGMMQGGGIFLIIITSIIVLLVTALILFSNDNNKLYLYSLGLILSGGVGNLIDRVARGFVIDYIDFRIINFAVFNFADCCVVIGTILFMIYIIFLESKDKKISSVMDTDVIKDKISIKVFEHKNEQKEKVNKYINVVGEVSEKDINPIIMSQADIPFVEYTSHESDDISEEIVNDFVSENDDE